MLKVSRLADYAVNILACMLHNDSKPISSQSIATKTTLSLPTVQKNLKLLLGARIITSSQGVNGGYQLLADPADISISTIIEAIDGPIALTSCCNDAHDCQIKPVCTTNEAWQGINLFVKNTLNAVNLLQISQSGPIMLNPLTSRPQTRRVNHV